MIEHVMQQLVLTNIPIELSNFIIYIELFGAIGDYSRPLVDPCRLWSKQRHVMTSFY